MAHDDIENKRRRIRRRLARRYTPVFKGPVEGWAVNKIKRELWRFKPYFEFEDMLQEAYASFLRTCKFYPGITNDRHFMAMFQTVFTGRCHDLATKRTKYKAVGESEWGFNDTSVDHALSVMADTDVLFDEPQFNDLIESAPPDIRKLIERALDGRTIKLGKRRGRRESRATAVCRAAGLPESNKQEFFRILSTYLREGRIACTA